MKRFWLLYASRVQAMKPRERLLLGLALVVAPVYLIYALAIGPALTERHALEAQMQKQRTEIAALEGAMRQPAKPEGPEAAYRQRESELRNQLAEADETIKALNKTLVPAQRVPLMLREMLARDSALQLQSLRTLPVTALMPDAAKPAAADARTTPKPESVERGVYKHGVEITVRGTYSALHAYLARLERSPLRMYWWRARLSADERASLTMTITIYTLSLDKGWLQV